MEAARGSQELRRGLRLEDQVLAPAREVLRHAWMSSVERPQEAGDPSQALQLVEVRLLPCQKTSDEERVGEKWRRRRFADRLDAPDAALGARALGKDERRLQVPGLEPRRRSLERALRGQVEVAEAAVLRERDQADLERGVRTAVDDRDEGV